MARSVEDATRFTPNGPYASRPSPRSTIIQFADPAPEGETPQQKMMRLREAAKRAKMAEVSSVERLVSRGRTLADKTHKVAVYGIIVFSAITGAITMFSLTDMIVYNRNKRRQWLEDMQSQHREQLEVARQAYLSNTATEDQILLLNQERIAEEARREKEEKGGLFKRTSAFLFGDLSREEKTGGKLADLAKERPTQLGGLSERESRPILKAVSEMEQTRQAQRTIGGPLDQMAEQATEAAKNTSKSWTSWIMGR